MSLSKIPVEERPRERLLKCGVEALSLAELLAILLCTGTKKKSVLELAHEIIAQFGSLQGLLDASVAELTAIKGLGPAKAIQLKAAFGIALKNSSPPRPQTKITAPEAYALVKDELSQQKQEMIVVILKDVRGRLIGQEKVSLGTLSEVLVHPREIFYPAVRHKASSFILAHNHPSGDPTPSKADLDVTRTLFRSSCIMGIALDDHLIIGNATFYSFQETGLLEQCKV
jgi:DNA repair protein RadC